MPKDLSSLVIPVSRHVVDNRHTEALAIISEASSLAQYLQDQRGELISRILRGNALHTVPNVEQTTPGLKMAVEFSDLIDATIARMFQLACATAGVDHGSFPMAIVATGGYGRRELAPYSDIDITFIPQRDGEARTDRVVRELFRLVMDVFIARCGLEVGYAYRLLSDCSSLDHQTASGLLDARQIAGSERLFIQFEDAFWVGFNATEFIFTKIDERESNLLKWGMLPRCVEPQIKEGPGGLRDLQTAVWLLQARDHLVAARVRGNRGLAMIARERGLGEHELLALTQAKEQIFRVRHSLHAASAAERDQLVVTRQEEVAEILGYTASTPDGPPAVELFMADLYPEMAHIRRTADAVMKATGNGRLMLGIGLDCKRREIVMANEALHSDDPVWLIWACELAQRYSLELSERVQIAATVLVNSSAHTGEPQQAAAAFTQILSRVGKVYGILQKMADLKILDWIVPEFSGLMDLIPYDASHDFTVGQHTLLVIKQIEDLLAIQGDEDQAELRRALQELPHPEYLMLAALLHDSGKATPGKPHAEESAIVAAEVCRRLGWSPEASGHVCFLVREHLLMGDTSRLCDLNMEKTIRDFVTKVDDPDRLNMLYLLTYADTRAVGEGIWTPVKGRFLRDLWQRATAALFEVEGAGNQTEYIADARKKIKRDLTLEKFDSEEVEEHIEAMPPYYLLNSSQREVALHLGFIRRVRKGEVVVDFHDERAAQFTELSICTFDDPEPGLLAKIAAVLLASSINVHSARVVTRVTERDHIALDTLLVDFKGKPLSPGKRQEVSANMLSVIAGKRPIVELLPRKPVKPVKSRGRVTADESHLQVTSVSHDFDDGISVIEASGPAALDLFYKVCAATAGQGLDIQSAKLSATRDMMRATLYLAGARHQSESEIKRRMTRDLELVSTHR